MTIQITKILRMVNITVSYIFCALAIADPL